MKFLSLLGALLLSTQFAFSNSEVETKLSKSNNELLESFVLAAPYIASENNTCIDDFELRKSQLLKKVTWGIPVGLAGVAGTTLAGGFIAKALYGSGTTAGGGVLFINFAPLYGALIGFTASAAAFVTIETINIVNFVKINNMNKILAQARLVSNNQSVKTGSFNRFVKKFLRKYSLHGRGISNTKVAELIVEADENGSLCDSTLVNDNKKSKFAKRGKLKNRLVNKNELMAYLNNNLK